MSGKSVAMASIGQRNLPPMELKKVSVTTETHGNSVAVDLCDLIVTAFVRRGYKDMNAAAILGMKPAAFSKAFRDVDGKYPDQNSILKRLGQVPPDVLKEFAGLLAERVGLAHGIDHELVQSSIDLARSIQRVMRLEAR